MSLLEAELEPFTPPQALSSPPLPSSIAPVPPAFRRSRREMTVGRSLADPLSFALIFSLSSVNAALARPASTRSHRELRSYMRTQARCGGIFIGWKALAKSVQPA